jgi:hypothetical protein
VNPAAYGADRDRGRIRNLFVGEPDNVTKHDRLTKIVRELE